LLFSGLNPVDIASYWGDPRVYDIVKTKWDSLPPPQDKKKGAKKGGGKRPASTPSGDVVSAKVNHRQITVTVLMISLKKYWGTIYI
jgi:hypothetical protein